MSAQGRGVGWRVSATYFGALGCLFLSAAWISFERQRVMQYRLQAPPGGTIGVTEVLSRARAGEAGDVGLAFLVLLGPVGGIFRNWILLPTVGVLLLLTAVLQYRRLRLGAVVGIAWSLSVSILLGIAIYRISAPYSLSARLLMFGPALALNLGLCVALGRPTLLRQ